MTAAWGFVKRHDAAASTRRSRSATCCCRSRVVFVFSFNQPAGRFNYVWQGFTLDNWINWDDPPGIRGLARHVARHRGPGEHHGDRARRADRARARPAPLPRPRAAELPHLPADGRAGDRARRLAADAVPQPDAVHARFWTIFIAHVMFCISVRRRHRARAARRLRPAPRGGGSRPRRERVDHVPEDHAAAPRAGDPRGRPARVRDLGRRLRDHVLQLGQRDTFPVYVWGQARGRAAAGERDRQRPSSSSP